MSVSVVINLGPTAASLITQYGASAKLYLESAATEGGAYSAVSSTALVSGTERYTIVDAAGTPGTTWYRFAPGTSSAVDAAAYSDPWLSTSLTAYATLDDLRATMDFPDTSRDALLEDMLRDASADIDAACGRSFYRSPQVTGTETAYVDVTRAGMRSLALASGGGGFTDGRALDIVSITTLEVRASETSSYTAIAAGDTGYYLQAGDGALGEGAWPYEDVILSPAGSTTTWPVGFRAVKVTGVRGFSAVPPSVRRAVIDETRERWRQGPGGGPTQQGVNQFGTPIFLTGDSPQLRRITRVGSPFLKRSWASL